MLNKKLTVNVITYNHENYISQCLDSILMQKTDFDFIVRIFDDGSTDKTQDICKQYKEKYPEKIELYLSDKNMGKLEDGTLRNALRSYDNIDTPYYIFIEGDDFCKDKKRFAKQVKILDENRDCICCCGKVQTYDENLKKFIGVSQTHTKKKYSIEDVTDSKEYIHIQHSGKMVRTEAIKIDTEHPHYFLFDITQMYELIQKGSIYFMDSIVSVYRLTHNNANSIYAGLNFKKQCYFIIDMISGYDTYSKYKFSKNLYNNMLIELSGKYWHYYEQSEIKKMNFFKIKLKSIKHYFIPRFILDICNIPRDLSRLIRSLLKCRRK